jgi:hypothetical protein
MALAARITPVRATGITRSRRVNVVAKATPEQRVGLVAATGALAAALVCSPAAMADLNRFEYNQGTEFGAGTALQYGGEFFHLRAYVAQVCTAKDKMVFAFRTQRLISTARTSATR